MATEFGDIMIIGEQIIPHPYYPFPLCRAEKHDDGNGSYIRWFDKETGKEYPPYFGYGQKAEIMVEEWLRIHSANNY